MTIIKLEGYRYTTDWCMDTIKEVNTKEIFGFELHYRLSSWHIVVKTREKCLDGYYTYEIGHGVYEKQAKELLNNPEAKILKIVNYHSSDKFIEKLKKISTN